jgi:signal transduction histidine kinase/DNA-binding response OmpR family regulator/HPt (histidine-containing phosphotransfer) domain-containing protein
MLIRPMSTLSIRAQLLLVICGCAVSAVGVYAALHMFRNLLGLSDAGLIGMSLLGVACAAGVAALIGQRLVREALLPIAALADAAQQVAESGDYSAGIAHHGDETLERLVVNFNHMLAQLQTREEALQQARATLETRIDDRTRELLAAKQEAENASRIKSQFLANVSHEIRTPMNGVLGMTDLLLGSSLTDAQRNHARLIRESGETLLNIINDLLDFSRIEAGRFEILTVPFSPQRIAEEVVELFIDNAMRKGVPIKLSISEDVPQVALGDPQRLRQILVNFVSNAVKFTDEGNVSIAVSAHAPGSTTPTVTRTTILNAQAALMTHDEPDWFILHVDVQDTGRGIAESTRPRLFSPFVQEDSSAARRYGGTGLGLAISRQLAHAMGGEVDFTSAVGAGSTFWVEIRLARTDPAMLPRDAAPNHLAGLRVMVIDSNNASRTTLLQQLGAFDIRPLAAHDLAHAERQLAQPETRVDLVLIDEMPDDGDAFVWAQHLHESGRHRDLPVVVVVPSQRSSRFELARRTGVAATLTKPVTAEALKHALTHAFADRPLPTSETTPLTQEKLSANVLLVEDNAVNREYAVALLTDLGCRVTEATNGREGVGAWLQGNFDLVLMDCQMPSMDGFEAVRIIRRHERETPRESHLARTPIVALTANALEGERQRCLAADFDDYLAKPFREFELEALVYAWAPPQLSDHGRKNNRHRADNHKRNQDESTPQVNRMTSTTPTSPDVPVFDPSALARLNLPVKPGDLPLPVRTAKLYIDTTPKLIADLTAALTGNNRDGLRRAAHTLKSSSAIVGAMALSAAARDLELETSQGEPADAAGSVANIVALFEKSSEALRAFVAEKTPG